MSENESRNRTERQVQMEKCDICWELRARCEVCDRCGAVVCSACVNSPGHRFADVTLERGFVTGGKTYGYRTVGVPSGRTDVNGNPGLLGKQRVIHDGEATVVRQIFTWAANRIGVFSITRRLQESVAGPWGRPWTQGTIRRILQNEVYLGKLIWGRVNYERQPGTNRMVRRDQPRSEWKVSAQPELRIVSDDLWGEVRTREKAVRSQLKGNLARGRLPGQSKYLFSGFLTCGKCGGSIVVVSSGKVAGPRYGCLKAKRQYTCSNDIEMSLKKVETRLLERLQATLQEPDVADYIIQETTRRAQEAPSASHQRDPSQRNSNASARSSITW